MTYYLKDWGDGRQSLYELRDGRTEVLAFYRDGGWVKHIEQIVPEPPHSAREITKEEAAMILFSARKIA